VDRDEYQRGFGYLGAGVGEGQGTMGILFGADENSFGGSDANGLSPSNWRAIVH
jgi:hypothetical protein